MTMMNSDSESQDSDDGRRFRFEATRKDCISLNSNIHQRKSPLRSQSRRSRSRDRSKDRSRYDRKDERTNYDRKESRKDSSRRDDRSSKDRKKDELLCKRRKDDLRHKNHKDDYDLRRRDSRDVKNRNEKRQRSRDSREKSYERSRDAENRKNRDRDPEKSKIETQEREKSAKRSKSPANDPRKEEIDEQRNIDDDQSSIEASECKDLNLSDFDIVSDTEESSDTSESNDGGLKSRLVEPKSSDERSKCRRSWQNESKQVKSPKNGSKSSSDDDDNNDNNSDDQLSDDLSASTSTSVALKHSFRFNKQDNPNFRRTNDEISSKNDSDDEIYTGIGNDVARLDEDYEEDYNDNIDDEFDDCYGPILPPTLKKVTLVQPEKSKLIGPCMPDELHRQNAQDNDDNVNPDDDELDPDGAASFGPSLPPPNSGKSEGRTIGPTIPDHLRRTLAVQNDGVDGSDGADEDNKKTDEMEDDGFLGPLPIDHPGIDTDRVQLELEHRARLIKKELAEMDCREENKREDWMTELPSVQAANLGLGPRKFRARDGPDMSNRSDWTDTPADRAKKQKELLMGQGKVREDDVEEERREKPSKREGDSLLEIHQKKINKKKKKEEKKAKKSGTTERRPFDRDIDMQVNRFDQARQKNIIMKAQSLDDRFSRGRM